MLIQLGWFLILYATVFSDSVTDHLAENKYSYEVHNIVTVDGYELVVHRILDRTNATNPKVVFLNHGMALNAILWILRGPKDALGYLLADSGYDVWMINNRGHGMSTHATGPAASNFWHFSLDDMAMNDTSVVIDYILAKTNQTDLTFVGHSQGCAIYAILCLTKPEYQPKINKLIAMAPVFNMKYPGRSIAPWLLLKPLEKVFGENCNIGAVMRTLLNIFPPFLHEPLYLLAHGITPGEINNKLLKLILKNYPDGESGRDIYQLMQWCYKDDIAKYDYGLANKAHYGSAVPPIYNLSDLGETPKYVFYGTFDNCVNQESVKYGIKKLKAVQKVFAIPYGHNDFALGFTVKSKVNDEILKILSN